MEEALPPFSEYFQCLNNCAEIEIDPTKPLKFYLRSTELVFKQAAVYYGEGDLEKSYILFMKFSNLFLLKLPKHPEFGKFDFNSQISKLRDLCRKSVNKLELIRPRLEQAYDEALEAQRSAAEMKLKKKAEEEFFKEEKNRLDKLKLDEQMNSTIYKETPPSLEIVTLNTEITPDISSVSKYELPISSTYNYDLNLSTITSMTTATTISKPINSTPSFNALPQLSGKQANDTLKALRDRMGLSNFTQIAPDPSQHLEESIPSSIPKYFSENGEALRPVHVPQILISKFLHLASKNTQNNLETCGVLAGKLHHDEFTITCLIIPKQVATSDTCAMINEEEIISAQDSLDVMSLGWIHTHPTQKCFLSSVDLHTHMPFQLLMAEAVAIVCAPTQNPNYGIFRLTDPPGLELITKCQHPSAFHPHPENVQIYRELRGPDAHAQLNSELPLDVIDLRK